MNKIKTAELTGAALDWTVSKCEGHAGPWIDDDLHGNHISRPYTPSTDWAQGGPIIEREFICIEGRAGMAEGWAAHYSKKREALYFYHIGDTPLIAAMRCYVASKLGGTIEIPAELLTN